MCKRAKKGVMERANKHTNWLSVMQSTQVPKKRQKRNKKRLGCGELGKKKKVNKSRGSQYQS